MNDSRQEQFINIYMRELVHLLIIRHAHETQYDISLSLFVNNEIISDDDLAVLLNLQRDITEPDHAQNFDQRLEDRYYKLLSYSFLRWMKLKLSQSDPRERYILFNSFLHTFDLDSDYQNLLFKFDDLQPTFEQGL